MLVAFMIIGGAAYLVATRTGMRPKEDPKSSQPVLCRKVRYGFTIQNKSDQLIEGAKFWVLAPVKLTANQCCVSVKSSHPCDITVDPMGNQVLFFRLDRFKPHGTRVIAITADIAFSDQAEETCPDRENGRFLGPEIGIESDHPAIIGQSRRLMVKSTQGTAANMFHWVSTHIRYSGYSDSYAGALHAFQEKRGDCTEYASLFTALCRAARIPARVVGGYVCDQDSVLKPSDYHNWAEYRLGRTWRIADPQKEELPTQNASYIAMRVHGGSFKGAIPAFERFRISHTVLSVKMNT